MLEIVIFCLGVCATVYLIRHMDSVAEIFFGIQVKLYGMFAEHPEVFARAAIAEAGCDDSNTTCVINAINAWVYKSVKYNYTNLNSHFFGFNDVLRYGGVCSHKVMVALIMLDSIGIDDCKIQTEITINDGVNVGHEWFECKINETYKLVCDPTNRESCTTIQDN